MKESDDGRVCIDVVADVGSLGLVLTLLLPPAWPLVSLAIAEPGLCLATTLWQEHEVEWQV